MHHTLLLTLTLTLLSTASAFVLPTNQAKGLYQVRRSSSGHEIHASLSTPPFRRTTTSSSSSTNHLTKRDWGHTYCGCGFDLSHSDTDAAVADLKVQLGDDGHWIDPGLSYYSIREDVVAFVCNENSNGPLKV
ncbi:hypothetical protein EJ02DRAFT_475785 [Clathrospora elynae]|uniref:Ecp2 effector protein domain-containing protein n=1 Tax=Clathrospora elynae TaxID=706981 RepID=A0A6A5T0P9_9PLEO|nr:hypothetical protein EJ02DRAFT_475785 [Clathrospora elynae]